MIYPTIPLAQSIIEICLAKGIQNIIISPGSRNAPLTIGFSNNPNFKCYSIADERCAAFFGLGIAQQTHEPVALICTSGSAVLNYYPAIAEAFYSQIPLIVISADRPQSKIDIGDGQTIRQENVFENHILYSANLDENASNENDAKICCAIDAAILNKGPVHINAPFEEPLYETTDKLSINALVSKVASTENKSFDLSNLVSTWNKAKKKLILTGVNGPNILEDSVINYLANDPSVNVFTEVTSNLHHPTFISSIDTIITNFAEAEFKELQPEILITFGGMVVSKRVKAFLRKYPSTQHWHIDTLRAYDTYGQLSHSIEMNPQDFFTELFSKTIQIESDYKQNILAIKKEKELKQKEFEQSVNFSDFKVYASILPKLLPNSQLQISNSAAIRYAQLFNLDPTIQVFCNRGTSGIDGSTSTAIGAAIGSKNQTTLITGDIGFLYDSNALWNQYIPKNFKIILVNNGGGGIFRILPGHSENEVFNTYFETEHCLTAEHLAKMFRFKYLMAHDQDTLDKKLDEIMSNNETPTILEIFTPTKLNDQILKDYFNFIK